MRVQVKREDPVRSKCDALIVLLPKAERVPRTLRTLDRALRGRIQRYLETGEFRGKADEVVSFPPEGAAAKTLLLVGLGEERAVKAESFRRAAGVAG